MTADASDTIDTTVDPRFASVPADLAAPRRRVAFGPLGRELESGIGKLARTCRHPLGRAESQHPRMRSTLTNHLLDRGCQHPRRRLRVPLDHHSFFP